MVLPSISIVTYFSMRASGFRPFWRRGSGAGSRSDWCYQELRRSFLPFYFSPTRHGDRQAPAPCFGAHRRRSSARPFWHDRSRSIPQAACAHLDKLKRPGAVFLRPFAGGLTRGEADQPIVVIETVELAIDPAMTKRRINRLW